MRARSGGRAVAFDAMAEFAKPCLRRRSTPERFWARVDRNGPIVRPELGPCWIWTGRKASDGYGLTMWCWHEVAAHRLAYSLVRGVIPAGQVVMHACDNPPCCNPGHLSCGTIAQNNADARAKGRHRNGAAICRGEANKRSKLTSDAVIALRRDWRAGESAKSIARRTGLSVGTVTPMLHGKTWAHVSPPILLPPKARQS